MAQLSERLRVGIVGCRRGLGVGKQIAVLPEYQTVAVCDLDSERADAAAAELGGLAAYTDYQAMLAEQRPDVVFLATNTQPRAQLTVQAANAGVPGIIAEKPMAMSMAEARAMVDACRAAGSKLIITHQRRMGGDLLEMRALIEEGALGDLLLVRASCAGDLLTDGTHAVDSMRFLLADEPAIWVLGQLFRVTRAPDGTIDPEFADYAGFRYGHPVEAGAIAVVQFSSGVRGELFTGKAQVPGLPYQDYQAIGTQGMLRRAGDRGPLLMWDAQPGGWREVAIRPQNRRDDGMVEAWRRFASYLRGHGDHPLSGENALLDHELVMAIYESARLSKRIQLPLRQGAFPLQLMIDEGRA
jgi:UDP-N-acetyl-2-amino-2-deoxyglucuronate dehydrogenase